MITGRLDKTIDVYGLSTDTKPTTWGNGSTFTEMDTLTKYIFKDNFWEVTTAVSTATAYNATTTYWPGDVCTDGSNTPTYYKCRNACRGVSPLVSTNVGYAWIPLL